jgi:hypothetical protein
MSTMTDPSEPDFKTASAKARFGWGCLAGFGLGMGVALGFATAPTHNYLVGLVSIPICTPVAGLVFLLFGKTFARVLWAVLRAISW